ncbi:M42 family metallopeptidase [Tepidimicrobium xylanilyticum]|uniref:Endoglucanase n=1 Tax=Tepidimicrobium xylanilyticum TaxID=1123352 RepID=A0A1H3CYF5_9FIRM|nr:M42 family metallopeptidase [Tepidimicrobium xylanilyticum]GMG97766.1 aminopeptidase [Tepidimicrobium xylanilyticum]SDX58928.1 endoglucanase [Tepidimicrobium xylanilyticum]
MLLKRLTEASGVSGNEKEVRDIIINEIKDYVDELKVDKLGNVIIYKKGKENSKKLMITAHMDEVGLMITDIDNEGLLKFTTVGGIDKRILVSKPVSVGNNKILGVIGAKPIHLQKREEWQKALNVDQLYIDIGAKNREEAEKLVSIGDYVSFDSQYIEFGENLVKAKALDNRVGCSLLIELIKATKDVSFYGVFTVMEEIGLIGAGPAAYSIDPDISIILEGTLCYEVPKMDEHLVPTYLNKGPAISIMDRTTIYNREFRTKITKIAEKNNIPYQYRKTSMGGNDSGKIHTTKEGSITATLSVPCRNIHSPTSIMSKTDYKNTFKLLTAILTEYKKGEL